MKQIEVRSKALKQGKELLYNNLATVLQENTSGDVKQVEVRSKELK